MNRALLCLALASVLAAPLPAAPEPVAAPAPAPAIPDLKAATVTIPYAELRALWEAAQPKPTPPPAAPEPPVPYAITQVRHALELNAAQSAAEGVAKFEIQVLSTKPTLVPLLGVDAALAEVNAEGGSVLPTNGFHALYVTSPGRKTVTLRYSLRARPGGGFEVPATPAAAGEVTFAGVPAGREIELQRGLRQTSTAAGPLRFLLSATDSLAFQLVAPQVAKPRTEPVAATWQVSTVAAAVVNDGRLEATALITATQTAGDVPSLTFQLPAQASVRSVQADQLERWEGVRAEDGRTRRVTVKFKRPEETRRLIAVAYELPPPPMTGEWNVAVPQVQRAEQERRLAYLVPGEATDLSAERAQPETAVPGALAGIIGTGRFVAVECDPAEPGARANAKARQLAATASATIEEASYQTRVVTDGAGRTNAKLMVRHERAQAVRIQLPAGAALLTCALDGAAASPVQTAAGAFELLLPARPNRQSAIEFSYTHRQKEFGAVSGELALSLPQVDLFTTTLSWEVVMPAAYELTAAEGNVQFASGIAAPESGVVRLRKELTRGETPSVAIFYQKRAL